MTQQNTPTPYYTAPHNSFANSFAGPSGCATGGERATGAARQVRSVALPEGGMLLDPSGRWALRVNNMTAESANVLLQILRDLAPQATQVDSASIRSVAAYDEAISKDPSLARHIRDGIQTVDALAHKLTKRRYVDVDERTMRRTLLSQLAGLPLLDRLGVRPPAYASAAI